MNHHCLGLPYKEASNSQRLLFFSPGLAQLHSQGEQLYWHIPKASPALTRWEIGQWRGRVLSLPLSGHALVWPGNILRAVLQAMAWPWHCSCLRAADGLFECWTDVLWGQLWMQKAEQCKTLRDKTSAALNHLSDHYNNVCSIIWVLQVFLPMAAGS